MTTSLQTGHPIVARARTRGGAPVPIDHAVGGEWIGGTRFEKRSPVTGEVLWTVAEAGEEVVDRAVEAARAALSGSWGRTSETDRVGVLRAIADEIDRRRDDLVAAEVADTGKPVDQARDLDVGRASANFRAFADVLAGSGLEAFGSRTQDGADVLNYAVRHPVGVVAIIVPWNLPLLLLTWKLAPALACGNAVVVKPSEETPASAAVLAEILDAVGLPPGVVNVVHGFGAGSAGEHLTRHPGVDAITFTGESRTGQAIMAAASADVKALSFELGGKNAGLVFDDVDLDRAVAGIARSSFLNGGQVCLCTERVYVHASMYEPFVERLVGEVERTTWDYPETPGIQTMPLISRSHRDKVESCLDLARDEGGVVEVGGMRPHFGDVRDEGAYLHPAVVTGLPLDARFNQEEVFGPVCHVAPFETEDEAIALANGTDFGLAASVWTSDLDRAHRAAGRLEAGMVWINTWYLRDLRAPFGGVHASGVGREGGAHSLRFYSELTNVCLRVSP